MNLGGLRCLMEFGLSDLQEQISLKPACATSFFDMDNRAIHIIKKLFHGVAIMQAGEKIPGVVHLNIKRRVVILWEPYLENTLMEASVHFFAYPPQETCHII